MSSPVTQHTPDTATSPQRSCVVCREPKPADALVRMAYDQGFVRVVSSRKGRSAYVCAQRDCLEKLTARHVSRSFKQPVGELDATVVMAQAHVLAHRRVLETLGLARRSGQLVAGVDSVERHEGSPEETWVMATDLADGSREKALRGANGAVVGEFETSDVLGQALGMGRVGLARVKPGRLAAEASYWLALWQETVARGKAHASEV